MRSEPLSFFVLGPLDVHSGDRSVAPPGAKRRGLLAMLLLAEGSVVAVDQLIEGLWGDSPPASAGNLVQGYVSLWRKLIEPRMTGQGASVLVTSGAGYRLRLDGQELDLLTFRRLLDESQRMVDARNEAALLRQALDLWRGPALADLVDLPFHQVAAARLTELRSEVLERWAAACLHAGDPAVVLEPLHAARVESPWRERLTELLMWALFAEGRQAEALAAYERTRQLLDDELGTTPGEGLRSMHLRVLKQDPGLRAQRRTHVRVAAPAPPADAFFGRDNDLAEVDRLLGTHRIVTLVGPGGAGKTRLALELAARRAADSDVPIVFLDATALTSAEDIPERLLHTVGSPRVAGEPALVGLAAALDGKAALLVVDNLEHLTGVAPIIRDVVAAVSDATVLATSRVPLRVRGEQVIPLAPLPVTATLASPALALFADRASAANPRFTLSAEDLTTVAAICQRLDGLPLAVELAAGWTRVLGIDGLLAQLDRGLELSQRPDAERPARHLSMRATVAWSYDLLDVGTRTLMRTLSVFRGGFDTTAAAEISQGATELGTLDRLTDLVDRSLLEISRAGASPRFRMLETVRQFAAQQLDENEDAAHECRRLHALHFERLATRSGPELTGPSACAHLDLLAREHDNLSEALAWLAQHAPTRALNACALLWRYWHERGHLAEGRRLVEHILAAAHDRADAEALTKGYMALGALAYWQLDTHSAIAAYEHAIERAQTTLDERGVAQLRHDIAYAHAVSGDLVSARRELEAAARVFSGGGDALWAAHLEGAFALLDFINREYDAACRRLTRSIEVFQEAQDRHAEHNAINLLGTVLRASGRLREAASALHEAGRGHAEARNASGLVWVLHELAAVALADGDTARAISLQALADTVASRELAGVPLGVLGLPDVRGAATIDLGPARVAAAYAMAEQTSDADVVPFVTGER